MRTNVVRIAASAAPGLKKRQLHAEAKLPVFFIVPHAVKLITFPAPSAQ